MKFIRPLLLLLIFQGACTNGKKEKEVPAGGPCTYKEEIHPAKLIKLETTDSINYDAQFETGTTMPDTIEFHFLNNTYIRAEQVKADSILAGKVYKLVEQSIISGSCNPHIRTIRLEIY
ncbi:MAG: hypothetical protein ABL876_06925 [Chitinophagaceae bacterium]